MRGRRPALLAPESSGQGHPDRGQEAQISLDRDGVPRTGHYPLSWRAALDVSAGSRGQVGEADGDGAVWRALVEAAWVGHGRLAALCWLLTAGSFLMGGWGQRLGDQAVSQRLTALCWAAHGQEG